MQFRRLTLSQVQILHEKPQLYSIKEYLHEKAEESRHNETAAYLVFLAGAIFFVSGVQITVTRIENLGWFLFFPYNPKPDQPSLLGLAFSLLGIALLIYGVAVGIYYSRKRKWYMHELTKAHSFVKNAVNRKNPQERKKEIAA